MAAIGITVEITDYATPALARAVAFLDSTAPQEIVGRMAVNAFGVNFDRLNQIPNALGGERTNYWNDAKNATSFEISGDTVTVVTSQIGAALHYYGGTVTPTKAKYLTIPAAPEAHGKSASDFQDLVVLFGRGGKPYGLGTNERVGFGTTGRESQHRVIFWLVEKATIPADPSVVPDETTLLDPIVAKLNEVIADGFEGTYKEDAQ